MRNATLMLAGAMTFGAILVGLLLGSLPTRPADPPRPNLEQIDFWTPTMNELAAEDPAGFEALPEPGTPGFEEAADGWIWRTRQTIFQRKHGRPYGGLPMETR